MGALAEVFSSLLLFCLVYGMSATVDIHRMRRQLRNKYALLTGVSMQFIVLPFVGFCVVKLFQLPAPVGITLLVVTSSPGGSYSNWWCSMFNADLALSVTMTALSTLLSVVMLPTNLIIYATTIYSSAVVKSLDWYALFMSLVVVIGGISTGLYSSARMTRIASVSENGDSCDNEMQQQAVAEGQKFRRRANLLGNVAGVSLISYSIFVSSSDHQASVWDQDWTFFVACSIPAFCGILIATNMATAFRLQKPERVAVAVESCYQNTGIATSVAITMFAGNKDTLATAIGVPLYYGIVEAVLLACFCIVCWKMGWTKAPPQENFCAVLFNSYEVHELEPTEDNENAIEVVLADTSDHRNNKGSEAWPQDLVFAQATDGAASTSSYIDEESLDSNLSEEDRAVALVKSNKSSGLPQSTATVDQEVIASQNTDVPSTTESTPQISSSPSTETDGGSSTQPGENEESLGRFGRTVSYVRARTSGYRKAPIPNSNVSPPATPSASLPAQEGVIVAKEIEMNSTGLKRPVLRQSSYEQIANQQEQIQPQEESSTESPPPIPVEGKTID